MQLLDTHLNKLTNQNLIHVPKVFRQMNKKMYCKTLGTSAINFKIFHFLNFIDLHGHDAIFLKKHKQFML